MTIFENYDDLQKLGHCLYKFRQLYVWARGLEKSDEKIASTGILILLSCQQYETHLQKMRNMYHEKIQSSPVLGDLN